MASKRQRLLEFLGISLMAAQRQSLLEESLIWLAKIGDSAAFVGPKTLVKYIFMGMYFWGVTVRCLLCH